MLKVPGTEVNLIPEQLADKWLTDNNDATCNVNPNLKVVKLSWDTPYAFTWMRLKVKESSAKVKFRVIFSKSIFENWITNLLITVLDNATVDYINVVDKTVSIIRIDGDGIKSLCSIYISGGRNVALRQLATQSSSLTPSKGADLAVDGITDNNYFGTKCTHTAWNDVSPSWTLLLNTPKSIQRIVVNNRGFCCSARLKNFKLEAFDVQNKTILTYTDSTEMKLVYRVSIEGKNNVNKIRISPTSKEYFYVKLVLSLCEVEVYGECVGGLWGLDCRETCPQDCSTWCHQDTGQCQSCLGFSDPPACKSACTEGYYGLNCKNKCRDECYANSCDRFTGDCDRGCSGYSNPPYCNIMVGGDTTAGMNVMRNVTTFPATPQMVFVITGVFGSSNPPYCNEVCLFGRWGHNCKNNCSDGCYNMSCDRVTGICEIGCYGYRHSPECNIECDFDRWGIDCQEECAENCYNRSCNSKTGVCDKGCNGYSNPPECNLVIENWRSQIMIASSAATSFAIVICIAAFVLCRTRGNHQLAECTKNSEDNPEDILQFNDSVKQEDEKQNITQVSSTGNREDKTDMDNELSELSSGSTV